METNNNAFYSMGQWDIMGTIIANIFTHFFFNACNRTTRIYIIKFAALKSLTKPYEQDLNLKKKKNNKDLNHFHDIFNKLMINF